MPVGDREYGSDDLPEARWTEQDDRYWKQNLVYCPKMGGPAKPAREWCLKANEIEAVNAGVIAIWDEQEVKENL